MYTDRIGNAIEVAAFHHDGQYRKNPERKIPFVAHVLSVAMMLAHHGYSEDVIIAGILHDSVEDTELTLEEIGETFGETVATLVSEVSEQDKSLSWEERKSSYIEQLQSASQEAKAISCCGVTHNMKSILRSLEAGNDIWQGLKRGREEQLDQFGRLLSVYRASLGSQEIVNEYEDVLNELRQL